MFPLHDRTRRRICRWAFITCGLLPTLGVVTWSSAINSSGHLLAVRQRLESDLGLEVRLAGVSYPRPGETLLQGLELVDRETGETLLRARLLEVTADEQARTLIAHQPAVEAAGVSRLWPLLARQLRGPCAGPQSGLHLAASELTIHWPGGSQTLVGCNAQLDCGEIGNSLTGVCRTAEAPNGEPIRVRVQQPGRSGQPATLLEFDTGTTPLACSLLAACIGCDNRLGDHSSVQGTLELASLPTGWRKEFAGELKNIDLHSVVSNQFPHKLGGTAQLKIKKAVVHAGRLESADGDIKAGQGVISQSLIGAAIECLGMQRGHGENASAAVATYEELDAGFSIGATGLVITGRCGDRHSGVVMVDKTGEILHESGRGALPVVSLVKSLVPDSQVQVPATRQSDWLLHVLPVPDIMPRDPKSLPQAHILDSGKM